MKSTENAPGGGKPLDILSGEEKVGKGSQLPEKREKTGSVLMQKVGLSALFLLIGMLVVALAFYLPAASKLREAQAEVERLSAIEAQYTTLQEEHAGVRRQASIYKTISSLGLLEAALLGEDRPRISQQLRYVEDDLQRLEAEGFSEVQQRLMSQFNKVRDVALRDPQAALNELRVLLNDLLLFADNL